MSEVERKSGSIEGKQQDLESTTESANNTANSGVESRVTVSSAEETQSSEKPNGRRRRVFIIGGSVLLVLALGGLGYWLYARQYESTDDAFIDGDIVQVSPKVSAYVSKIYVKNNQFVHKGDLL